MDLPPRRGGNIARGMQDTVQVYSALIRLGWTVRDHVSVSVLAMSKPQLISARSLIQLGRTIRQVLTSKSSEETIRVHGWVKSVRLQKRIAFAMIHDGTTPKGLQVVFRNPTDAKLSVPSSRIRRTLTYSLQKVDKRCKCLSHRGPRPKPWARPG